MIVVLTVAVAVAHDQPGTGLRLHPAHGSLLAQLPPYYVTLGEQRPAGRATYAVVRATATGKVLAKVRPPRPYTVFSEVSAAADDHAFVVAASSGGSKKQNGIQIWLTSANKFLLLGSTRTARAPAHALPIPPDFFRDLRPVSRCLWTARSSPSPSPRAPAAVQRSRSSTW